MRRFSCQPPQWLLSGLFYPSIIQPILPFSAGGHIVRGSNARSLQRRHPSQRFRFPRILSHRSVWQGVARHHPVLFHDHGIFRPGGRLAPLPPVNPLFRLTRPVGARIPVTRTRTQNIRGADFHRLPKLAHTRSRSQGGLLARGGGVFSIQCISRS